MTACADSSIPFYALITFFLFFPSFFPFISNNCNYQNLISLLLFPIKINVNVVKTVCFDKICRRTLEKIQISLIKSLSNCQVPRRISKAVGILVISRNGDRIIMQSIRITSRPPSRNRKWNQLSQF